jgi:hypothetical protein
MRSIGFGLNGTYMGRSLVHVAKKGEREKNPSSIYSILCFLVMVNPIKMCESSQTVILKAQLLTSD